MRQILLSTGFLGAGLGFLLVTVVRWYSGHRSIPPGDEDTYRTAQFLASGPLIGAGIMVFFNRARIGAYLGVLIEVGWCLGYSIHLVGWKELWLDSQIFVTVLTLTCLIFALGCFAAVRALWRLARQESSD
jgi:hypothetical protein